MERDTLSLPVTRALGEWLGAAPDVGALAEVGVYRGASARLIASQHPGRELHLFDTFAGLPNPGPYDHLKAGMFLCSVDDVADLVECPKVRIYAGTFPDTLEGVADDGVRWAFVHVNCDLYAGVKACCEFFPPRLVPGGVIFFSDYGNPITPGARRAIDESGLDVVVLPEGPAVVRS